MWIAMNDSFISIVADRDYEMGVVVRARVKEDLVALFPDHQKDIIETEDSDYRFRLFLDQQYVAMTIEERVMGINYDNFKNSVKQSWRKTAYMRIWDVMNSVQESLYGKQKMWDWYQNYR